MVTSLASRLPAVRLDCQAGIKHREGHVVWTQRRGRICVVAPWLDSMGLNKYTFIDSRSYVTLKLVIAYTWQDRCGR